MNRTPIVGLKKFGFDDRRCGFIMCDGHRKHYNGESDAYIAHWNIIRHQEKLGGRTPEEFEERLSIASALLRIPAVAEQQIAVRRRNERCANRYRRDNCGHEHVTHRHDRADNARYDQ